MPLHLFSDDCPGCRPAAVDTRTGQALPDDHPLMQKILRAWGRTTLEQRQAWHAVTCLNSRKPTDMELAKQFVNSIQAMDH
jgi:hypothetical protein